MTSAPEARVGVVVLNWNGLADTLECLRSLHDAEPRPPVVVVVDNGSREDPTVAVRRFAAERGVSATVLDADGALPHDAAPPWLVLLRLGGNRGFAGGNNAALRLLRRQPELTHFLLLNNDAVVAPDYLARLDEALRASPDAGLLSGTIYEFERRDVVWYAGGDTLPRRALVRHREHRPASDAPVPTSFVTGCAMVIARRTLDVVGPLAECYHPAYVEDAEYSWRVRAAGLPLVYAPAPAAYHRVGASAGRSDTSPFVAALLARHRAFFVRRNLRGATRLAAIAYLVATKPARAAVELLRGRPTMAGAILGGTVRGLLSPAARRETPGFP